MITAEPFEVKLNIDVWSRIPELAQGRSYWNRLRFLDVCETASEIFSRKYFNKYFLIAALELVQDPVVNVRYTCPAVHLFVR